MPATSPGIWLHITKYPEPNRDHEDQGDQHPTSHPQRHIQSSPEEISIPAGPISRPEQATVSGFTRMVIDRLADGWSAYLVTVVFRHLPGQRQVVLNRMKEELTRVYATLVTRVHRKPKTVPTDELPALIAVADLPVFKWDRVNSPSSCNEGLHYHAILMVPADTRLRQSVVDHFQSHADLYAGPRKLIEKIHVVPVNHDPDRVVDYVFKSVTNRRVSYDEAILVLPRTRSELDATDRRSRAEAPARRPLLPQPS